MKNSRVLSIVMILIGLILFVGSFSLFSQPPSWDVFKSILGFLIMIYYGYRFFNPN